MKKYYAITISDHSGSKHYFLNPNIKRNLVWSCLTMAFVLLTSFTVIYQQQGVVHALVSDQHNLNQKLARYDSLNSRLGQDLASHEEQAKNVSQTLADIERISGVETGDLENSLTSRISLIKQFYNAREAEYNEIGSRVEQIEDVIGMDASEEKEKDMDLLTRVELASLSASQKRILHDSIPNGFPTDSDVITSKFGTRKHPVTKINSFHNGVDIRAKSGKNIYATADGFVLASDYSNLSGNRIVLSHNFGFESRFSHLKEKLVKPGEMVHKGDLIGYSGNTGRSSASHLHYEVRYLGKAINPQEFLEWEFGTHDIFTTVEEINWPSLISLINKQIIHQTLQLSQLDRTYPAE